MKYKSLQLEIIPENQAFLRLGIIEDSLDHYVLVGKILPDMSLEEAGVLDEDIGMIFIELIQESIIESTDYRKLVKIEDEEQIKKVTNFVEMSGMGSLFLKMVKYIYDEYDSVDEQIEIGRRLNSYLKSFNSLKELYAYHIATHKRLLERKRINAQDQLEHEQQRTT